MKQPSFSGMSLIEELIQHLDQRVSHSLLMDEDQRYAAHEELIKAYSEWLAFRRPSAVDYLASLNLDTLWQDEISRRPHQSLMDIYTHVWLMTSGQALATAKILADQGIQPEALAQMTRWELTALTGIGSKRADIISQHKPRYRYGNVPTRLPHLYPDPRQMELYFYYKIIWLLSNQSALCLALNDIRPEERIVAMNLVDSPTVAASIGADIERARAAASELMSSDAPPDIMALIFGVMESKGQEWNIELKPRTLWMQRNNYALIRRIGQERQSVHVLVATTDHGYKVYVRTFGSDVSIDGVWMVACEQIDMITLNRDDEITPAQRLTSLPEMLDSAWLYLNGLIYPYRQVYPH